MIPTRISDSIHLVRKKVKNYCITGKNRNERIPKHTGKAVWSAAGFLFLFLGGCSGDKLIQLKDQQDFEHQITQSEQPVLVEFYKGGCPTCVLLEPNLAKLAEEYKNRVTFARFELMAPYFAVKAPELKERYNVSYFPTVILFVEGQEKKRWVLDYNMDKYRNVLDETIGSNQAEPSGTQ